MIISREKFEYEVLNERGDIKTKTIKDNGRSYSTIKDSKGEIIPTTDTVMEYYDNGDIKSTKNSFREARYDETGLEVYSCIPGETITRSREINKDGDEVMKEIYNELPWLDLVTKDLGNNQKLTRGIEYNTGTSEPEDFFQLDINQTLTGNRNEICRENSYIIVDREYDKDDNEIRTRTYSLCHESFSEYDENNYMVKHEVYDRDLPNNEAFKRGINYNVILDEQNRIIEQETSIYTKDEKDDWKKANGNRFVMNNYYSKYR